MESGGIRLQMPLGASVRGTNILVLCLTLGMLFPMLLLVCCASALGHGLWDCLPLLPILLGWGVLPLCVIKQRVIVEREGACVTHYGKPSWGIAASQMRFIAMIGDDRDVFLCLSGYTIDELAEKREQQLLRNWFSKDEVPLRKRKVGWRETFANEHLLKVAVWNIFALWRPNGLIILPPDTTLLALLRKVYPQLPYYHLSTNTQNSMRFYDDTVVPVWLSDCKVCFDPCGIRVVRDTAKNVLVWSMPKEQICTIVCMEVFRHWKSSVEYNPIIMISDLAIEELAESAPKVLFEEETQRIGLDQEQLAIAYCQKRLAKWSPGNRWMCPVLGTDKNRKKLQEYYPDAKWVDLSDRWMNNSP